MICRSVHYLAGDVIILPIVGKNNSLFIMGDRTIYTHFGLICLFS